MADGFHFLALDQRLLLAGQAAYIDDELTVEARLEMETFIDENEDARGEFESHLAAWEAAQSAQSGAAPEGLWEGIEAGLQTETGQTSLDDLALMIRGLAGEVQDLRREVRDLRGEMQGGDRHRAPTRSYRARRRGILMFDPSVPACPTSPRTPVAGC